MESGLEKIYEIILLIKQKFLLYEEDISHLRIAPFEHLVHQGLIGDDSKEDEF